MKCDTTSLEIESILGRIKNGDINLQPDFQRGEVWSANKKKKLIDSILRGWKIPPIHLVQSENAIDEVLDGQQRLVSIRDFFNDVYTVDGSIRPLDTNIKKLDGKKYSELPVEIQRLLKKYSLTLIRLTEYSPEEPAELFYRLNQPVSLTAAEQRNAYIGITRDQIKNMVKLFDKLGAGKDVLGFSNSRLAYDEIISKFCYCVEIKTLRRKIAASDISDKYRSNTPFGDDTINITKVVLSKFLNVIKLSTETSYKIKFSKATLFSWLVFIKSNININDNDLLETIRKFEISREYLKGKIRDGVFETHREWYLPLVNKYSFFEIMMNTYNQRASMGSTDALSVIYRDVILNVFYSIMFDNKSQLIKDVQKYFDRKQNMAIVLEKIYDEYEWGVEF
ncbi:DUF262 domain-containing protein [Diplocloster hominis]|uniref:DUF262 domain-containing protein n=1 Tax=Diplocloster hominis TaxID=3079010 RepID=UPI0031BB56F4